MAKKKDLARARAHTRNKFIPAVTDYVHAKRIIKVNPRPRRTTLLILAQGTAIGRSAVSCLAASRQIKLSGSSLSQPTDVTTSGPIRAEIQLVTRQRAFDRPMLMVIGSRRGSRSHDSAGIQESDPIREIR